MPFYVIFWDVNTKNVKTTAVDGAEVLSDASLAKADLQKTANFATF